MARPPAGDGKGPPALPIERGFLRLAEGLVHFRSAGARRGGGALPLFLAHAGPGSSRAFEPMLPSLARHRFVVAPDMLGNGDSAAPASDRSGIGYYVDAAIRVMDGLGLERVDFLGSHTGAQIGCQLAVDFPHRVNRLILDGIPLFSDELRASLLGRYAPQVVPDDFGGHLSWAWNFVRDQSLYWPYFDRQGPNRLANAVPSAEALHRSVVDVLKALGTYHLAYRAAFAQDLRPLLPRLAGPVLLMASEHDPLSKYLDEAAGLVPGALKRLLPRAATADDRVQVVEEFLDPGSCT